MHAIGRPVLAPLVALAASVGAAFLVASDAQAGRAKVLGAAERVDASCPADCLVEAKVSGFQLAIGRRKNPFRVPRHGRIVAWSIKLGAPVKEDVQHFNREFGPASARISILKPIKVRRGKRTKVRYRLLRQGPVQELQPFFGETTTFGLQRRLKVRRGNIVALTIPTWAPAFAVGLPARWRASRAPSSENGPCATKRGLANLAAGDPHERKGSERRYGCAYRGARLLYSARFIAKGR